MTVFLVAGCERLVYIDANSAGGKKQSSVHHRKGSLRVRAIGRGGCMGVCVWCGIR
ncbi:unnamed protein product [Ectocarpus sp. 8 AP-2014]